MTRRRQLSGPGGRHFHALSSHASMSVDDHMHLVEHPDLADLVHDTTWWRRPVPTWVALVYGPAHLAVALVWWWLT